MVINDADSASNSHVDHGKEFQLHTAQLLGIAFCLHSSCGCCSNKSFRLRADGFAMLVWMMTNRSRLPHGWGAL